MDSLKRDDLDSLRCPLSGEPFKDPVILVGDGYTYERVEIARWLRSNRKSPSTGEKLKNRTLVVNNTLRATIDELRPQKRRRVVDELLRDEPGYRETRDAVRVTVSNLRNESDAQTTARYAKYYTVQGLLDALDDDVLFLRGSWLLKRESGCVLPKRNQLPREAVIFGHELRQIYEARSSWSPHFPLIAVSHSWRSAAHPDPEGVTTTIMRTELQRQWSSFKFSDVGIFFDWCSLPESPRTPRHLRSFERALLWYVHQQTLVWVVTDAHVSHPEGWTMCGWALAHKTKSLSSRIVALGDGRVSTKRKRELMHAEPMSFYQGHRYQFTANELVAPLFKKTTDDVLSLVDCINYNSENWDDVDFARLGLVLPLCVSLRWLCLQKLGLTARGLRAILQPVVDDKALPNLERLQVSDNQQLGDHGASVLASAFGGLVMLLELYVADCDLTAAGLSAMLGPILKDNALPYLKRLDVSCNVNLGDDGARALGAALKQGAFEQLQNLSVASCCLSARGLDAILKPIVHDKALSKLDSLNISGNKSLGDDGARALGTALSQGVLKKLKDLNAASCNLTARGLHAMNPSALSNLEGLDISGNESLGDAGARVLGVAWMQVAVTKLKYLRVKNVGLTPVGLRAILEYFFRYKTVVSLRSLDVSENRGLGDDGACVLAAALKQGTLGNLDSLDLRDTGLTVNSVEKLLLCIIHRSTGKACFMLHVGDEGRSRAVDILAKIARRNPKVKSLLRGTSVECEYHVRERQDARTLWIQ